MLRATDRTYIELQMAENHRTIDALRQEQRKFSRLLADLGRRGVIAMYSPDAGWSFQVERDSELAALGVVDE